jgi:hypothetical protein
MNRLADIDQHSVEYVCLHLRPADAREALGLCPHDSVVRLGYDVLTTLRNHGRGRVVWHRGEPAAVIGFAEYRPGVWQAVLLGTDHFPAVARDCLKWFRDTARELRDDFGARRVQVDSHIEHWDAHKFLRALGARPEGPPMRQYGKRGDAYQRFVWLAGENDKFISRKAA